MAGLFNHASFSFPVYAALPFLRWRKTVIAACCVAGVQSTGLAYQLEPSDIEISGRLYGDFRLTLNQIDERAVQNGLSIEDNASRIGLKGAVSSSGLKLIYHYQFGMRADTTTPGGNSGFSTRFAWAGVEGSAGRLIYGVLSTPYKLAGLKLDPFYDSSAGRGFIVANHGLSRLTNGFTANGLSYRSPEWAGLSIDLAAVIDDSDADSHALNYGLRYQWRFGGLSGTAGLQYIDLGDSAVVAASAGLGAGLRLHSSGRYQQLSWGLSYEGVKPISGSRQEFIYLAGSYGFKNGYSVQASVGDVDAAGLAGDGFGYALKLQKTLLKQTDVFVLYSNIHGANGAQDRRVYGLGVKHRIGWDF